jgi:hypothetical protein
MKRISLQVASTDQLVAHFADLAIEQDDALLRDDISRVNRLFDRLEEVEHVLKTRAGDQRRVLLGLYNHPNMNVRVKAAKATLAVAPQSARAALEAIAGSKWQPQAGDAGMCLWALDEGIFKPT